MMLSLVEAFLGRTRTARSNADIVVILGQLAADFGFRSAYLLEYGMALNTAVQVLDSDAIRARLWAGYFSSGVRPSTRTVGEVLHRGGVYAYDTPNLDLERDPLHRYLHKLDIVESVVVPISFDDEVMGLIGLSGKRDLSSDEERALQFICYTIFSQTRSFRVTGMRPVTSSLTPREREVVGLSAQGMTSQEVADELGMSARTVNQHVDNVALKLGTRNRAHTVGEAIRRELL